MKHMLRALCLLLAVWAELPNFSLTMGEEHGWEEAVIRLKTDSDF
jgi:hypothetical protein